MDSLRELAAKWREEADRLEAEGDRPGNTGATTSYFYDRANSNRIHAAELEAALSSESPPDVEDVCECGHLRSEHVMGKNYCSKGCYTTEEQAEYFRTRVVPGFGERPTCLRFTVASQPEGKP